jgi:hypothetical protein
MKILLAVTAVALTAIRISSSFGVGIAISVRTNTSGGPQRVHFTALIIFEFIPSPLSLLVYQVDGNVRHRVVVLFMHSLLPLPPDQTAEPSETVLSVFSVMEAPNRNVTNVPHPRVHRNTPERKLTKGINESRPPATAPMRNCRCRF